MSKDIKNIINETVEFINETYEKSNLDIALAIGERVFRDFFDSDLEAVACKKPTKKTSFNKLCEHEDLGVERSQLSRMVNVHIQEEVLKEEEVGLDKLTYSHRVELLKIKDENAKIEMAKKCTTDPLTIRALRDEISKIKIEHDEDKVKTLKITSQTMARFEASEKAIIKINELIAEADVQKLATVTRNKLHEKAISLQEHITVTANSLAKLIEEIDKAAKKK